MIAATFYRVGQHIEVVEYKSCRSVHVRNLGRGDAQLAVDNDPVSGQSALSNRGSRSLASVRMLGDKR